MLTTTTIGAYPKPESVAVETWFGERARRPSDGYEAALGLGRDDLARLARNAFEAAFLQAEDKRAPIARLDADLAER